MNTHPNTCRSPRVRTGFVFIAVVIVGLIGGERSVRAQHDETARPAAVDKAIAKGIRALRKLGSKGSFSRHRLGEHALAVLALLHCEVPLDDKLVASAIRHLGDSRRTTQNYDCAVGLMVIAWIHDKRPRRVSKKLWTLAREWTRQLIEHQNDRGAWSYAASIAGRYDNSNTQYAILGLRAADKLGLQVPVTVWRKALDHLLGGIGPYGGLGYRGSGRPTVSMTAGALSSIAAAMARSGYALTDDKYRRATAAIRHATDYLAEHWKPNRKPHSHYTSYGLERAMAFTRQRRLGTRDWYAEGAKILLERQRPDGNWSEKKGIVATSFALLFLSRASRPTAGETVRSVAAVMSGVGIQSTRSDITAAIKEIGMRGAADVAVTVLFLQEKIRARRMVAIGVLRKLTKDRFGYDASAPPDEADNIRAIKLWRQFVRARASKNS